jgi:hypothetical protein
MVYVVLSFRNTKFCELRQDPESGAAYRMKEPTKTQDQSKKVMLKHYCINVLLRVGTLILYIEYSIAFTLLISYLLTGVIRIPASTKVSCCMTMS